MTRANITIRSLGRKFELQLGSDGYPEEVVPILKEQLKATDYYGFDLYILTHNFNVSLGHVGNPYFYYDLDLDENTLKCYKATTYWVNAPENWKERGWYCWLGENGKYGYTNWRRGRLIQFEKLEED